MLVGRPGISFAGPGASGARWQIVRTPRSPFRWQELTDPPGSLRALRPGKSAVVGIWWRNWSGRGNPGGGSVSAAPDAIVFGVAPGDSISAPVRRSYPLGPRCDAPGMPSVLSVTPFAPLPRRPPPGSHLPLRVAITGPPSILRNGVRVFLARRGPQLRFRVALTNAGRRTFRFRGCPVYLVHFIGASSSMPPPEAYVLNCRPIGAMAPHETVLLEMRVPLPGWRTATSIDFDWELAPRTAEPSWTAPSFQLVPRRSR